MEGKPSLASLTISAFNSVSVYNYLIDTSTVCVLSLLLFLVALSSVEIKWDQDILK